MLTWEAVPVASSGALACAASALRFLLLEQAFTVFQTPRVPAGIRLSLLPWTTASEPAQ